ncbi:MAG TPA: coenzyme F420 hydrogenase [Planctomycetes bacterium]|nr:coenzyme F420 hydrogenase [Planctomycetota bacterium]
MQNVLDVAKNQLCTGCGACAYIDPSIEMIDVLDQGRRPKQNGPLDEEAGMAVCPGAALEHEPERWPAGTIRELAAGWGPVLELWEGYAADEEIRFAGSSGGAASALSLFCLEKKGMEGVLHTGAREDYPYLNQTVFSQSREELLARTGSRYAPASPCQDLGRIEEATEPSVFVGKPCDVAATHKARGLRPALDPKLGLTIAIFCAGTPSTAGTLEMMKAMGCQDPRRARSVRYRGKGWPGMAEVRFEDPGKGEKSTQMTYADSWGGILQKRRQWRCYICLDHTGEFADISVGDPWYRPIPKGEPGRSLIVVRSERGRAILEEAMAQGYIEAERVGADKLPASQVGFQALRGKIWGRRLMLKLMGVPFPRYKNMPMFRFWLRDLGLSDKLRSILGTFKRIFVKKLNKEVPLEAWTPPPPASSESSEAEKVSTSSSKSL